MKDKRAEAVKEKQRMQQAIFKATERIAAAERDRDEWKTQHENLLAIYRAQTEEIAAMRRLSPAPQTGQVTEAMVEAGFRVFAKSGVLQYPAEPMESDKLLIAKILRAALGTKGQESG